MNIELTIRKKEIEEQLVLGGCWADCGPRAWRTKVHTDLRT